jgi:hypothetical protein
MVHKEMSLNDYFPEQELTSAQNLIHVFHDRLFLESKLSDLKGVLISLYMCNNGNKKAEVDYDEVKNLFLKLGRKEENFKANLYLAKKDKLVNEIEKGKIKLLYLTIEGLKTVKDMLGYAIGARTWLIESGKVFSGKKLLQEILIPNLRSDIKICDPYCGTRLLDLFSEIKQNCKISLLTQTIEHKEQFKRELKDFLKEFSQIKIEVKIFSGSILHDRYIISNGNCWSIGTSLKDLGKKDAIITRLDDEVRYAIEEIFEKRWQNATLLV